MIRTDALERVKKNQTLYQSITARLIANKLTNYNLKTSKSPLAFMQEMSKKTNVEDVFHVVDISALVRRYKLWQEKLSRVKAYYAIKTNHDPVIVNVLSSLGLGFDCASINEINLALSSGTKPSDIILAHTRKSESTILEASYLGIQQMTFDSLEELQKIIKIAPNADLILRIKTNDGCSLNPLSSKFGASLEQAKQLLLYSNENNIKIKGICFHIGSNARQATQFQDALNDAWELIELSQSIYGSSLEILDLGGGWPGNNDVIFNEMTDIVNRWLDTHDISGLKIIAEPGRFFATQSVHTAMKIIGKDIIVKNNSKHISYYLCDGIYGSYLVSLYYQYNYKKLLDEGWNFQALFPRVGKKYLSTLWGPTCDSGDYICQDWPIQEMNTGEYIYSNNVGSYTTSLQTPFNGITQSRAYYLWCDFA